MSDKQIKLRRNNTSGYPGVSWHKAAKKWGARIRVEGHQLYLGLFETAEAAYAAYRKVASNLSDKNPKYDAREQKVILLSAMRELYKLHGIKALSTPFLEKQKSGLYPRLLAAGLKQPLLLAELGLADEYAKWRLSARTYRGVTKPKWSWQVAVMKAQEIKEREGDLPTVEWFRVNGYSSLTHAVHASGRTWENLREAVGCFRTSNFCISRNRMRWRSRPEASLSNFLYARGVNHKRGERYPAGYSKASGRLYGSLDMHFVSATGAWIDVEIWGDPLNALSAGRYRTTRAFKESWQAKNPNFLGIPYRDCVSDVRLTVVLKPYIGIIAPFQFDKPTDRLIETSHWSDADELLSSCRKLAAQMPGGIFPSENWLRKRGKYVNRPGPLYNTLAVRVNQWLGGTRSARKLLGHGHASTIAWTPEQAVSAWQDFEKEHGVSPSQCRSQSRRQDFSKEVVAEASKICAAARYMGVLAAARGGIARKHKWTPEHTMAEWKRFVLEQGRTPSECMSAMQRRILPRAVTDEATRIYWAARKLGILAIVREKGH